jgi:hypothetical protein
VNALPLQDHRKIFNNVVVPVIEEISGAVLVGSNSQLHLKVLKFVIVLNIKLLRRCSFEWTMRTDHFAGDPYLFNKYSKRGERRAATLPHVGLMHERGHAAHKFARLQEIVRYDRPLLVAFDACAHDDAGTINPRLRVTLLG